MEEWNVDYMEALKSHYLEDVVNAMLAHATGLEFTRMYALVALTEITNPDDYEAWKMFKDIKDKAEEIGYTGTPQGINWGLHALWEVGVMENQGGERGDYRLNPRFRTEVKRQLIDLKSRLATFKTKQKPPFARRR